MIVCFLIYKNEISHKAIGLGIYLLEKGYTFLCNRSIVKGYTFINQIGIPISLWELG